MAINVIHNGNVDSFDMLAFPSTNPGSMAYIQNQFNNFSQSLTDIGRQFMQTTQVLYERVHDNPALRAARAAIRAARTMFHPNEVVHLRSLDELRYAQPVMQRYIMAEPTIRELYHRQQVDGYSDTYADIEPTRIKETHYDYRRVMTGCILDTVTEDGEDSWVSRNYSQDDIGIDQPLTFQERIDIMNTWDIVKMFVEQGTDPSDPFSTSTP